MNTASPLMLFASSVGISSVFFFFFNDTATTEIYTLSLHDALPISTSRRAAPGRPTSSSGSRSTTSTCRDRKSTRLNSSHGYISYAVFCLKKKNKTEDNNSEIVFFTLRCRVKAAHEL